MNPPIRGSTPQWQDPPSPMALPKIHKEGTPLRLIVSSVGAVTYSTSNELSRIHRPPSGGNLLTTSAITKTSYNTLRASHWAQMKLWYHMM